MTKFAAVSVGFFFVSVVSKLPVSILKRNKLNKRLVSDSAKTSFGSSFGCLDTKLVSEDTLNTLSSANRSGAYECAAHHGVALALCSANW